MPLLWVLRDLLFVVERPEITDNVLPGETGVGFSTLLDQEPVLGENVGLTGSRILHPDPRHNVLIAEYLQNGSIGRRLNIEAGVWNDGVAFRYIIPRTTPLQDLLIEDEETEFSFAHDLATPPRAAVRCRSSRINPRAGSASTNPARRAIPGPPCCRPTPRPSSRG